MQENGVEGVVLVVIQITDSIAMIDVECPPLPQGVDPTRLNSRMIDANTVLGEGF